MSSLSVRLLIVDLVFLTVSMTLIEIANTTNHDYYCMKRAEDLRTVLAASDTESSNTAVLATMVVSCEEYARSICK